MIFSKCSIAGVGYNNALKGELGDLLKQFQWKPGKDATSIESDVNLQRIVDFLLNLSINHTVVADENPETKGIVL